MYKKFVSLALAIICVFLVNAQQPLPLNPEVRYGVLPNGLTYYILHNEHPRNRANFYIAQKVGSALETPEQYGLAHFLEHMAFNGTRHYPGDSMLRYLESKGIRFGADVNAYTDFEETVYNIDNVPTDNTVLMDSVLLALRDWSCDLLLEDAEIDAERKVIQEEWRMRNDPVFRFRTAMAPVIFSESQYHHTPIGTMDVVMNFPYKALRDYYHKWYRPDQQGIIIVGDFNAEDMEKKVVEMFSDIPMPENAAPREYVRVSDNNRPLFFAFEDPELKYARVDFQIKFDKMPLEYQNTDVVINSMMQDLIADMINTRLYEHTLDADCRYANAGVYFADMYPSKTKEIFNVAVISKDDELGGFGDAFQIVVRACRTGFTQSELDRAIENLKSRYDKRYNERNNTNTSALAKELINAFKDNVPAMGIANERDFFNNIASQIPLTAYNQMLSKTITPNNQVILVQQQKKDGKILPSEQETIAIVSDVLNRQYEAYVDETVTEPLISQLPAKGEIAKTREGKFGTTEITLSNGVRVIVKPTDYKEDEVLFQAFRKGGKAAFRIEDAANVRMLGEAFGLSNFGTFDNKTVTRYLTGKNVSLGYDIGKFTDYFEGSSSVKDLPTLMELIYTSFTDINPNEENYNNYIARIIPRLEAAAKSPEFIFESHKNNAMYAGNPMETSITADVVKNADYKRMFNLYKEAVTNPADYTFLFTGNVDIDVLKPLLEQYVASLPSSNNKNNRKVVAPINTADGEIIDNFTIDMTAPADWLYGFYSGTNIDNTIQNQVKTSLVGDIVKILYTEILREKEGGVYSPMVYSDYDFNNSKWYLVYLLLTNEEQSANMLRLADDIFVNLLKEGATADQFNRVKGALLSQYENNVRTNTYWQNNIRHYELSGKDFISGHRAAIEDITLDEFNDFMRNLYDGKNRIQVNMHGIAANI